MSRTALNPYRPFVDNFNFITSNVEAARGRTFRSTSGHHPFRMGIGLLPIGMDAGRVSEGILHEPAHEGINLRMQRGRRRRGPDTPCASHVISCHQVKNIPKLITIILSKTTAVLIPINLIGFNHKIQNLLSNVKRF
jgi:hypothetical protein